MIAKGSFEDFLYIFIGLIWIGFSIYKAQQKKKASAQSEVKTKKEKSFFENLINEFINEETENPYAAMPQEQKPGNQGGSKKLQDKKVFSYDDYYEESNATPDFNVIEKKATISTELEEDVKTFQQKRTQKSRIDLRRAVIYSEILNRKYY